MPRVDETIPADNLAAYARDWDDSLRSMPAVTDKIADMFAGGQSDEFYRGALNGLVMAYLFATTAPPAQAYVIVATLVQYLAKCRVEGKTPGPPGVEPGGARPEPRNPGV